MASWAAWSENKPALVEGLTDPNGADAVLVTPPAQYTPPDPKPDFGMAPMQKDDGSPAKPAAPFELKYE